MVNQTYLNDQSTITSLLTKKDVEEKLQAKLAYAYVESLAPGGQAMVLTVDRDNFGLGTPYFATTDLSVLVELSIDVLRSPMWKWSWNGSSVMMSCGTDASNTCIVSNAANNKPSFLHLEGNPVGWSPDGTEAYTQDSNRVLWAFSIVAGTRRQVDLPPILQNRWVQLIDAWPDSKDILLIGQDELGRTVVYRVTDDFSDPIEMATIALGLQSWEMNRLTVKAWSPDRKHLLLRSPRASTIIKLAGEADDGVIGIPSEIGEFLCGWSADNHFVTFVTTPGMRRADLLRFWNMNTPAQPVLQVDAPAGMGICPLWFPIDPSDLPAPTNTPAAPQLLTPNPATTTPTVTQLPSPTPWPEVPIFDDFSQNDLDQNRWGSGSTAAGMSAQVGEGVLMFRSRSPGQQSQYSLTLNTEMSPQRPIAFEAMLRVDVETGLTGLPGSVFIQLGGEIPGYFWTTECRLSTRVTYTCSVSQWKDGQYIPEYDTPQIELDPLQWYVSRIEWDPKTATLQFYLDGEVIGTYSPLDAEALRDTTLRPSVGVRANPGVSFTATVDDVRLSP